MEFQLKRRILNSESVRLMKIKVNKAEDARPELTAKRAERKQKN